MKWYKAIILVLLLAGLSPSALAAERLAVAVPVANIRSGPGTDHEILWNAEQYYPVMIEKKSGAWYYFRDFEGDKGWLHKDLMDKTRSVITKTDKCNVRSAPGTKHDIVFTVDRGIPFKVLKQKGDWLHIQHADGDKGWIHKALVW